MDREKDIYLSLAQYTIVITDYSSIAYDFILLDRPVVFFNYDFKSFADREVKLNYDYEEYSPGIKTKTWEETMDAVEEYLENPEKDGAWRRKNPGRVLRYGSERREQLPTHCGRNQAAAGGG